MQLTGVSPFVKKPAYATSTLLANSANQASKALPAPAPAVSFGAKKPSSKTPGSGQVPADMLAALKGLFQGGSVTLPKAEEALLQSFDDFGVPELSNLLLDARDLAQKFQHTEVTPLHVLAVQFGEIVARSENQLTQLDAIKSFEKNEKTVWNANIGPLVMMNSPKMIGFHAERLLKKIEDELKALPKAAKPSEPKFSENLMAILENRLSQLKRAMPSEQELQEESQMMMMEQLQGSMGGLPGMPPGGLPPELQEKVKAQMKKTLAEAKATLESADAANVKRVQGIVDVFKNAPTQDAFLDLADFFKNTLALEDLQAGKIPKGLMVSVVGGPPGQPPREMRMPLEKLPPAERNRLMPQLVQSLKQGLEQLKGNVTQAWASLTPEINKVQAGLTFDQFAALLPTKQIQAVLDEEMIGTALSSLEGKPGAVNPALQDIMQKMSLQNHDEMLVAAYDNKLEPRFLEDKPTAKAHQLFSDFYDLLSGGKTVEFENMDHYLQTAVQLGAGDTQINTLTALVGIAQSLKHEHLSNSMAKKSGGPDGRDDGEDISAQMYRMKLMQQLSGFIRAYANVNWNKVQNRQIDLHEAKATLEQNDLIPTPIKHQLMTFLKTGNQHNWQKQPLLLLAGDGATGLVKSAVVQTLSKILKMPITQPSGELQTAIRLGGRRNVIKGEPTLSPFAKALIQHKTPASLMYVDNLLRFSIKGGEELFEQFATQAGRTDFKEPDFDVPFDLSPYVMVVGIEDGMSGQYLSALHGDRFNDVDMTLIELGEDIDTFTKEKVAEQLANRLERQFNVKFGPGVVKTVCRDYAILGRHDYVESRLRDLAKKAAGANSESITPTLIKLDELETKWLGPKTSKSINNVMDKPTVGSINGLAAGGHGYGCVLRVGVSKQSEWLYDPRKDTGGRYSVRATLGPVTQMTEDSAKKAFESFMSDYLNNTVIGGDASKPYKLVQGLRHKAMSFQVVFPENVDGPSAGAAMASTAVSVVTGIPIRPDIAITGTIQDKGTVGPIGGIFGKTRAAFEAGIRTVVMPEVNYIELKRDHPKFTAEMEQQGMKLVPVKTMDDVLKVVLTDYDALFKEPTPEQLAIESYDPTGELKKQNDSGEGRIRALVEEVVKANQDANATTQNQLADALKLIAQLLPKPTGN
jgi:ATP-dependent Lon protease